MAGVHKKVRTPYARDTHVSRTYHVRLQVYREEPLGDNPETIDEIWRDMVLPDDLTCGHCSEVLKTYGGLLNHLAWGFLHREETGEGEEKVIQVRST